MVLDRLEASDGTSELFPLAGIFHRHLEDLPRSADHLRTFGDGAFPKNRLQDFPAVVQSAEKTIRRDTNLIHTEFTLLLSRGRLDYVDAHSLRVTVHKKEADPGIAVPALFRG